MKRVLLVALLLAAPLFGDGGIVLARQDSGPFTITVFAAPADWSVLVQRRDTLAPVLDATVSIRLTSGEREMVFAADHAHAQNKLLYAAPVALPQPGDWKFAVAVNGAPPASGVFKAAPAPGDRAAYWFYFALPAGVILLFLLHQRLAARTTPAQTITNQSPKRVYTVLSSR
ncbi:MAG TPA: hypothetical protein VEF06_15355 [Bryobacteraceae bacterium]|nr:hypothetical protein [Bryobacteraceae bacterium]